jgi:hypothetical protein
MKTKEEILAKITDRTVDNIVNGCINVTASQALKAMQSYHRQFLPSPQETIKDESPVLPSEITERDVIEKIKEAYTCNDAQICISKAVVNVKELYSQLKSQKATPQVSLGLNEWKGMIRPIMEDGIELGLNDWAIIDYCKNDLKAMRDGKIKTQ